MKQKELTPEMVGDFMGYESPYELAEILRSFPHG